jgi:pyruvate dehydrogenase E2 component (dihydrolipoamide acetyltransferase)
MPATVNIVIPDLGDFENVEVIEILVKAGDVVEREDGLITVETDKATMDIPSAENGAIESLTVAVGDTVSTGDVIGTLTMQASDTIVIAPAIKMPPGGATTVLTTTARAAPKPVPEPEQTSTTKQMPTTGQTPPTGQTPSTGQLPAIEEAGFARAHASPSVRKLARELGVNLVQVKGSGTKSRILHDDIKAFVKAILTGQAAAPSVGGLPKTPRIDFAKFGEIDVQPLTRIQKISGSRLQASWINLPHVTQHDLADITDLEARRQELKGPAKDRGIPLTPLSFIMKACVAALAEFPMVNSSLSDDGKDLVYKKYCHLGFAADTPQGLVVPVIRDADTKDVYEIAAELAELSALAREGNLKAQQMQGSSFTISSLGGIGGTSFTPIINAPEVAILGVSRSTTQPTWDGERFKARLMLPLSFSYDHRVIDGAQAVRFTTFLGRMLADVDALLHAAP